MTTIVDGIIDSIQSPGTTAHAIPSQIMKAPVACGYIAGNDWLTFEPYQRARPDLAAVDRVIPITLTAAVPKAYHGRKWVMYDMESGGGHPQNIGFFASQVGRPFLLYTFASAGEAMLAWAKHFGFKQGIDFFYVSAHANGKPHVCAPDVCGFPRADWGQYLFAGLYDRSQAYDYALPPAHKPKPPDPYQLFPTFVGDHHLPFNGNERDVVEHVDGALKAWHEHHLFHDFLKDALHDAVKTYRDRIWRVSHYEPPTFTKPRPKPDWSDDRGLRWQGLNNRLKEIDALP